MNKQALTLLVLIFLTLSSCTDNYQIAEQHFKDGNYEKAIEYYKKVANGSSSFEDAVKKLDMIDSIIEAKEIEQQRLTMEGNIQETKKLYKELMTEGKLVLKQLSTFNPEMYRGDLPSLRNEIDAFKDFRKFIVKLEFYDSVECKQLYNNLNREFEKLLNKEYPKLRASYAKILDQKLCEDNIDVTIQGNRNTTILFVGGIFTSNKSIKEFKVSLNGDFELFKFKSIRFKWYEGADEYTYFTFEPEPDTYLPY
jgi:hypothetical protein